MTVGMAWGFGCVHSSCTVRPSLTFVCAFARFARGPGVRALKLRARGEQARRVWVTVLPVRSCASVLSVCGMSPIPSGFRQAHGCCLSLREAS